jgi:two-component system OmpR family response regulator
VANILIVEDNDMLNRAYRMILEKSGHTVQSTTNGQEALDAVKEFQPKVILLDLLMPKMGGIEFLRQYDAIKSHKDVKVVVLTNLGKEEDIQEAMDLGAYKYIIKAHSSPADLAALVNHLINKNVEPSKDA